MEKQHVGMWPNLLDLELQEVVRREPSSPALGEES